MSTNDYENELNTSEEVNDNWRPLYSSEKECLKTYYEQQKFVPGIFIVIKFIGIFLTITAVISLIKEFIVAPSIFQLPSLIFGIPLIFCAFVLFPNAMVNNTRKKPLKNINDGTAVIKYVQCIRKVGPYYHHRRKDRSFTVHCLVDSKEKIFITTKHIFSLVKVNENVLLFKYGDKEYQSDIFAKDFFKTHSKI